MKVLNIEVWVFITVFSIAVIVTVIYMILQPDKSLLQGFSPFPDIYPSGVPPPNLQQNLTCKNTIQECLLNTDCQKCGPNFACTEVVGGQNVHYNGINLRPGNWCLPKQDEKGCGTYTGRAVWSAEEGQEKWTCQCLYPELFGGDTCLDQYACKDTSEGAPRDQSANVLISKTGEIWDPHKIPPHGLSPYARDPKTNEPIFTCSCKQNEGQEGIPKFVSLPNSPYHCNLDPCSEFHSEIMFNSKTNSCDCKFTNLGVLSNKDGVCRDSPCQPLGIWDQDVNECSCGKFVKTNCSSDLFYRAGVEDCSKTKQTGNPGGSSCGDPCASNPCKNNSVCAYDSNNPNNPAGYKCICPEGYTGSWCETGCQQENPPGASCGANTCPGSSDPGSGIWEFKKGDKNCLTPRVQPGVPYQVKYTAGPNQGGVDSCYGVQSVKQCASGKGKFKRNCTYSGTSWDVNVCE